MACRVPNSRRSRFFAIKVRCLACNSSSLFKKLEDPLFMGDLSFFAILRELASAHFPLVRKDSNTGLVTLTEVGCRVLEFQDDRVHLNGIDRWLGGVPLTGTDAVWRWDNAHKCMRFA